jgi:hypothetical protein
MAYTDGRQSPSLTKRTALAAAVIAIFSIGLGSALSQMVRNGVLSSILSEIKLRRLAGTAPSASVRTTTTVQMIDVDGIRTSTIIHR